MQHGGGGQEGDGDSQVYHHLLGLQKSFQMICHMTRLVFRRMKDDQVDNESCNMEKVVRRVLEVANLEVESKLGSIVPTTKNFSSIGHLGAEIIQPEQTLQNKTDIYGPLFSSRNHAKIKQISSDSCYLSLMNRLC